MEQKVVVESLDGVAEDLKKHYKLNEGDNKYYLDIDPLLNALSSTKADKTSLQSKAEQLQSELEKAKANASQVDLEKYNSLLELEKQVELKKQQEAEEKAKREGDIETLQKQWQEKLASTQQSYETKLAELAEANGRIKYQEAVNRKDSEMRKAMSEADVIAPHFIEHAIAQRVKTEKLENGDYVYKIIKADGSDMLVYKDDKMVPADLSDLMSEFKKDSKWAAAFKPTQMSGVNATGGANPAADGRVMTKSEFNSKKGPEWAKLAEDYRAGKLKLIDG